MISSHQASVLDHLDELEGTPVTMLADHFGVTPSTMSLTIDRLENKGFVDRRRDSNDKRRVLLHLTRAGVRVRDAKTVLDPQLVRTLVMSLRPADRTRALEGLALLADAAQQVSRSGWRTAERGRKKKSAQSGSATVD